MLHLPAAETEKKIVRPSGENAGRMTLLDKSVSRTASCPSLFIRQSWLVPLRLETNAIDVPSGETTGCELPPLPKVSLRKLPPKNLLRPAEAAVQANYPLISAATKVPSRSPCFYRKEDTVRQAISSRRRLSCRIEPTLSL